jgi:presenilin-like A22 family membrane protease
MKHTVKITLIMLGIFFIAQLIGLFVIHQYINQEKLQEGKIEFENLPLKFERPALEEKTSFVYILVAILIGTVLALLLIKFEQLSLWKIWFLVAVFVTLNVAFNPFMPGIVATTLAAVLALWKIYKPNFYIHNFTEFFIYGGLAAIFVPVLSVFSVIMLLIFISAYDAYAVWKSKHMVKLAEFQTKSKMFAGLVIPYKIPKTPAKNAPHHLVKIKTAILGGGDIGFPLLFAGVVFKELILMNSAPLAFAKVLLIPVCATAALGWLLYAADQNKFYPAMPAISLGCFIAFIVMNLIGFL